LRFLFIHNLNRVSCMNENILAELDLNQGDVDAISRGALTKVNLGEVAVYAKYSSRKREAHEDLRTITKSYY